MLDYPNVKIRFACILGSLGGLAILCLSGISAIAQDDERKEPEKKSLTLAEKVLQPLAETVVIEKAFEGANAKNTVIQIDLTHQMMTVTVTGRMAVTCPVTTGRKTLPTRPDTHVVTSRSAKPDPSGYGHFVDKQGRVLVRGVYQSLDPPPAGAMFVESRQSYALGLGKDSPRIVSGHVRSTPCTNGDVIVPEKVALILFKKIVDGTKVVVTR